MSKQEIIDALAQHALFNGLSDKHLTTLADHTQLVTVTAGQMLGQEGESANAFFLLRAGKVNIEMAGARNEDRRLQTIGAGEIVGWSWLVPPHRWRFDARVVDTVQALQIDARALRDRMEADHDLGYEVLKRFIAVITSRLTATRTHLLELEK